MSIVAVEMNKISFSYDSQPVLKNFNLNIDHGKIYCLVGSSGSGKTTALRLINGLLKPSSGKVVIGGENFNFSKGEEFRRAMGYSIQGSGLFPHMTLRENLTIIARKEKWKSQKIESRLEELCKLMDLPYESVFLNKKPREISGGQQQRIGIARALFMSPNILLMDEPFSALDPVTRSEIQKEFLSLQKKLKLTIILVTHDLSEAFRMAHEIVLLNRGKIEQKGRPSQFLLAPESLFVEEFMKTHSPGNILKEIYLYSVLTTNFFATTKSSKSIVLKHMENARTESFQNINEASEFLKKEGQLNHYHTSSNGQFLESNSMDGTKSLETIRSTDTILDGMKKLLATNRKTLPVINDEGLLVGAFTEEALDAL